MQRYPPILALLFFPSAALLREVVRAPLYETLFEKSLASWIAAASDCRSSSYYCLRTTSLLAWAKAGMTKLPIACSFQDFESYFQDFSRSQKFFRQASHSLR